MRIGDRARLEAFRVEARSWLEQSVPSQPRPRGGPELRDYDCAWQRRQFEGGWAGINWPRAYGGRGLSLVEQVIWYEELVRARAPVYSCFLVALNNVGPTIMLHGTQGQKAFYLPRILRGDTVWCQGFSEPGAGSDLASVKTTGTIEADHLVISGSKIWTSFAQFSDYSEVLVRTDPSATKHAGLTLLVVDMHSAGIEIRPIEQIDGTSEFCEVFFDRVRVPLENVLGQVNRGWQVAMSTLAVERGPAVLDMRLESIHLTDRLVAEAKRLGLLEDGAILEQLARVRAQAAANRAMAYYQVSTAKEGAEPGPETTGIRTFHVELEQRIAQLAIDMTARSSVRSSEWTDLWLRQFQSRIGGGTTDIQKNIIGERVLGLPR
jgi:alkylation response protein AidB-like acyl-CoA dehydrogenase